MKVHRRLTRSALVGLAVCGLAAPVASAEPARELPVSTHAKIGQDLRSADTRDSGSGRGVGVQDLRSADTKDSAAGRGTSTAPAVPDVTVVKVANPAPSAGGMDWGDAGIGAGGVLGLALVTLGGTLFVTHRRHAHTLPRI
jgi:hypothetical protein